LSALAFSPDGARLAGASRERVQLWDVASGQDILFLRGAKPRPSDNGFNPRIAWSPDGARLAVANWDRTVSVWDAGDQTTAAGKAARARQAAHRACSWHLGRAETYGGPGTTFAAAFHRERLQSLDLTNPFQRRRRGDFLARSGQWGPAAADYAAPFAKGLPQDLCGYPECSALLVQTGDLAGYRRLRERALAHLSEGLEPLALRALLRAGGLAPCSAAESAQLQSAARRLHEARPGMGETFLYLGLAHYRAGAWGEARRWLEEAEKARPGGVCTARLWMLQGLVHLREGNSEEAERWLARADAWLAEQSRALPPRRGVAPVGWDWLTWLEVRSLRGEAEGLLRKDGPGAGADTNAR
jgi:tetratricopeptide (TPR) repeat protein